MEGLFQKVVVRTRFESQVLCVSVAIDILILVCDIMFEKRFLARSRIPMGEALGIGVAHSFVCVARPTFYYNSVAFEWCG